MKYVLYLLLLLNLSVYSQTYFGKKINTTKSKDSCLNFFPCNVGNTWYYSVSSNFKLSTYTTKITKITQTSDGFKNLYFDNYTNPSFSIDSLGNVYKNSDGIFSLFYKMNADSADTIKLKNYGNPNFNAYVIAQGEYLMPFNGKNYRTKIFCYATQGIIFKKSANIASTPSIDPNYYVYLGYGLGKLSIRYTDLLGNPYNGESLKGCVISGDTTGNFAPLATENYPTKANTYSLSQNYPNPFNPSTAINYNLTTTSNVQLKIFNLLGKEIVTLVNETQKAGNYRVSFDASKYNLTSGVYYYELFNGQNKTVKKMMLIK